jgi:hypothetical protein
MPLFRLTSFLLYYIFGLVLHDANPGVILFFLFVLYGHIGAIIFFEVGI